MRSKLKICRLKEEGQLDVGEGGECCLEDCIHLTVGEIKFWKLSKALFFLPIQKS